VGGKRCDYVIFSFFTVPQAQPLCGSSVNDTGDVFFIVKNFIGLNFF